MVKRLASKTKVKAKATKKKTWRNRPRNVPPMPVVDKAWFFAKMAEKEISLRSLASQVGLLPASLSRRFDSKVRITLEEVGELAHHLDQPFDDVLRAAGVTEHTAGGAQATVMGRIDAEHVRIDTNPGGRKFVPRPPSAHGDAAALRVEAPGHFTDGWLLFYHPTKRVEPESVGRLAVIGYSGTKVAVRIVSRGADRGVWRLEPWAGGRVSEAALEWAAPVIGIRC